MGKTILDPKDFLQKTTIWEFVGAKGERFLTSWLYVHFYLNIDCSCQSQIPNQFLSNKSLQIRFETKLD